MEFRGEVISHDVPVYAYEKGQAFGVAELDENAKVPFAQLPESVTAGFQFMGTWNAANTGAPTTNNIILSDGGLYNDGSGPYQAAAGQFFRVSVANATTTLDGATDWVTGDWAVSSGTAWSKADQTDAISTVAGRKGDIVLTTADITDLPVAAASTLLQAGAITVTQMGNASVGAGQLIGGSVGDAALATNAVSTVKIQDLAVTGQKLAANAVATDRIQDAAVTNAKIADAAITTTKYQDASISTVKIIDGAISTLKLGDAQVTTAKLPDATSTVDGVTPAKLAIRNVGMNHAAPLPGAISTQSTGNGTFTILNSGDSHRNHYWWRGKKNNTLSTLEIYACFTLPADFLDWDNSVNTDNIEVKFSTSSISNLYNSVSITATDTSGALATLGPVFDNLTSTVADTPRVFGTTWVSGSFQAGEQLQLKIVLAADRNEIAKLFSVRLNYRTQ
jgi:hypothetical protein